MSGLWCLHVLGPDDVHPAPSRAEAERAAEFMNARYSSKDPPLSFEAAPWPYSALSHAEDVDSFYTMTGLPVQPGCSDAK